jgi:hypothetical protein
VLAERLNQSSDGACIELTCHRAAFEFVRCKRTSGDAAVLVLRRFTLLAIAEIETRVVETEGV